MRVVQGEQIGEAVRKIHKKQGMWDVSFQQLTKHNDALASEERANHALSVENETSYAISLLDCSSQVQREMQG